VNGSQVASLFALGILALPIAGCSRREPVRKYVIGSDTPIKVGGGATTFYSLQPWSPAGSNSFCTNVSGITSVELDGFDGESQQSFPLESTTAWKVAVQARKELVTLHSFYPSPLPQGHPNIRLLSKCSDADEDACERTHSVTLSTDSIKHKCDDLDCWLVFRTR
jgi:hypothetical protein